MVQESMGRSIYSQKIMFIICVDYAHFQFMNILELLFMLFGIFFQKVSCVTVETPFTQSCMDDMFVFYIISAQLMHNLLSHNIRKIYLNHVD